MNNRDMPAKPIFNNEGSTYDGYGSNSGLTKLEYAAIHFHAARLVNNKHAHPQDAFEEANLFFDEQEE